MPGMHAKPRLLVISPSNLATDPRVHRQLRTLRTLGSVTAAGFADPQLDGVEYVPIGSGGGPRAPRVVRFTQLLGRRYARHYHALPWVVAARRALAGRSFDLVVANDAESWPLGDELRGDGRLLCDAHEYAPREFEDVWWWRWFYRGYKVHLCRRWLRRADGVLTVCPGIAREYERVFRVRPIVVMNVPPAAALQPSPVEAGRVRMVHHGAAQPGRRIEDMIAVARQLDERFTLDLMLVPSDPAYVAHLRTLAADSPRVRFVAPVPMPEISAAINGYDVGLYLLAPTSFNNRHALPNKFFEFIQARLAIAIGPSPEMARIVAAHECGIVAPDFRPESLATALRDCTTEQIAQWKRNAHGAARRLCWEEESAVLLGEVERLLALGRCAA